MWIWLIYNNNKTHLNRAIEWNRQYDIKHIQKDSHSHRDTYITILGNVTLTHWFKWKSNHKPNIPQMFHLNTHTQCDWIWKHATRLVYTKPYQMIVNFKELLFMLFQMHVSIHAHKRWTAIEFCSIRILFFRFFGTIECVLVCGFGINFKKQ